MLMAKMYPGLIYKIFGMGILTCSVVLQRLGIPPEDFPVVPGEGFFVFASFDDVLQL